MRNLSVSVSVSVCVSRPVVGGPVESAEEIFWATALQELQGEWQCVLSRQADANAFVTGAYLPTYLPTRGTLTQPVLLRLCQGCFRARCS